MTEETPSGVNLRETLGLPTPEQVKDLLTEFPGKKEGKSGWQADLSVYGETSERLRQTALSGGKVARLEATVLAVNPDLKDIPSLLEATKGFLRGQITEVGFDPSSKDISLIPLVQQAVERELAKSFLEGQTLTSEQQEKLRHYDELMSKARALGVENADKLPDALRMQVDNWTWLVAHGKAERDKNAAQNEELKRRVADKEKNVAELNAQITEERLSRFHSLEEQYKNEFSPAAVVKRALEEGRDREVLDEETLKLLRGIGDLETVLEPPFPFEAEGRHYMPLKQIGGGKYCNAYLALTKSGIEVIKAANKGLDPESKEQFNSEINILSALISAQERLGLKIDGHPLTPIYRGEGKLPDGRNFFAMDYADGINLMEITLSSLPVSLNDSLNLTAQYCRVLEVLHDLGKGYLDTQPAKNVFWNPTSKRLTLIDFNLLDDLDVRAPEKIQRDLRMAVGTLLFILVRKEKSKKPLGKLSLDEQLGSLPDAGNLKEIFEKVMTGQYSSARELREKLEVLRGRVEQGVVVVEQPTGKPEWVDGDLADRLQAIKVLEGGGVSPIYLAEFRDQRGKNLPVVIKGGRSLSEASEEYRTGLPEGYRDFVSSAEVEGEVLAQVRRRYEETYSERAPLCEARVIFPKELGLSGDLPNLESAVLMTRVLEDYVNFNRLVVDYAHDYVIAFLRDLRERGHGGSFLVNALEAFLRVNIAAKKEGIARRDKPLDGLMVNPDGKVVVLDWDTIFNARYVRDARILKEVLNGFGSVAKELHLLEWQKFFVKELEEGGEGLTFEKLLEDLVKFDEERMMHD